MSKYVRQEKSLRKHPVASSASSLIKAPSVPTAPKERPGFKGPGFIKKTPKQVQQPSKSSRLNLAVHEHLIPQAHQQLLLNVVRTAFPVCMDYETLKPMLQGIRLALLEGDSEKAFSRQDWMEAYAVRWSSTRALCCAAILLRILDELELREEIRIRDFFKGGGTDGPLSRIVCFGGGPTETLAFAAILRHIQYSLNDSEMMSTKPINTAVQSVATTSASSPVDLYLVDQAPWAPLVSSLEFGLANPPVLSKYASQSAKLNNLPFLCPGDLKTTFLQKDILTASKEDLAAILGPTSSLITLLFTLNDLHTTSNAKAAALILKITLLAPKDSFLLVIDSAEPASETAIGASGASIEKGKFKMGTWLDMVLMGQLGPENVTTKSPWRKVLRDENRVFKLAEGLKFPISLDHVNFQMYLFKKR